MTPRLSLPRAADRIGILSFEFAAITQRDNILVASTSTHDYEIPTAQLTAILAGPGTSITHRAAALLADNAVTLCWTGQGGIRSYATITPLATQADLLHRQIECWADPAQRYASAVTAYRMRFPDDFETPESLIALRAAEGRRVKQMYRDHAEEHDLPWTGRTPKWEQADPLNRAITAVYHCFYGAAANVISALGCHHALGFIHTGKRDAFVYDIADLHKLDVGLPIAFAAAGRGASDTEIRADVNAAFRQYRTLATMVSNVYTILNVEAPDVELLSFDDLQLYDPSGNVPGRTNYMDSQWL